MVLNLKPSTELQILVQRQIAAVHTAVRTRTLSGVVSNTQAPGTDYEVSRRTGTGFDRGQWCTVSGNNTPPVRVIEQHNYLDFAIGTVVQRSTRTSEFPIAGAVAENHGIRPRGGEGSVREYTVRRPSAAHVSFRRKANPLAKPRSRRPTERPESVKTVHGRLEEKKKQMPHASDRLVEKRAGGGRRAISVRVSQLAVTYGCRWPAVHEEPSRSAALTD